MKPKFYSELTYVLGLILLPFGAALMTMADFGVSMIVAPAYILHLKVSESFGFFTFGVAEYTLQAVLLMITVAILRKFRISYLLSFVTAFLYGMFLDVYLALLGNICWDDLYLRIAAYVMGIGFTAVGVALFFRTYISPEVYELFVKEVSAKYRVPLGKFKTFYDCGSLVVSVIFSFAFFGFGSFVGIGWGTLICALINGKLIGLTDKFLGERFEFCDRFKWRKYF